VELRVASLLGMTRRPSPQTQRVLVALATDPEAWRHGYELGREVGVGAGSLYPILIRLHERGYLESRWESSSPQGRPPRHEYRLTATGASLAREWRTEARGSLSMRPAVTW
jgi:PadR family transcriptional regulator PadR